ncbi:hypothetical protein [Streptomyces triculaminicus]|uniref:hypothetical protein n=1 Tax=Streptomyces triculaminicus TaxID=2816232 RepID=UPI0037D32943
MTQRVPAASRQVRFPTVESFTQGTVADPHWKRLGSARPNGDSPEPTPNECFRTGTAFLA